MALYIFYIIEIPSDFLISLSTFYKENSMRLFIAITFNDILKKKIYGLEMEMKKYGRLGGNFYKYK